MGCVLVGWIFGDGCFIYNVDILGIVVNKVKFFDGWYIVYEEKGVSRDVVKINIFVVYGFLFC